MVSLKPCGPGSLWPKAIVSDEIKNEIKNFAKMSEEIKSFAMSDSPLFLLFCAGLERPEPVDLPPNSDPLTRSEGQVLGGAVALTETALNATIHKCMSLR